MHAVSFNSNKISYDFNYLSNFKLMMTQIIIFNYNRNNCDTN